MSKKERNYTLWLQKTDFYMSILAPIVLFVYNRPWHTSNTLNYLLRNKLAKDSVLYIFSDGFMDNDSQEIKDKIKDVRKIIRLKPWCKNVKIIETESNIGFYNSMINGLSYIFTHYDKAIILEDDIVTSEGFLEYMNSALEMYKYQNKVCGISGYSYFTSQDETYFLSYTSSWGWGTWKRVWDEVVFDSTHLLKQLNNKRKIYNFNIYKRSGLYKRLCDHNDGIIQSWSIQFYCIQFLKKRLFLYPRRSMVLNIGFDEGVHCNGAKRSDLTESNNLLNKVELRTIDIEEERKNRILLVKYFKSLRTKLVTRIIRKIKRTLLIP